MGRVGAAFWGPITVKVIETGAGDRTMGTGGVVKAGMVVQYSVLEHGTESVQLAQAEEMQEIPHGGGEIGEQRVYLEMDEVLL